MPKTTWSKRIGWTIFVVGVAGLAAIALLVLVGSLHRQDVTAATPLFLAVVIIVLLGPWGLRELIARLSKVTLPAVGTYEFLPSQDPASVEKLDPEKTRGLVDLRLLFQAQFAHIAKHDLVDANGRSYVTVGSLRYDDLIADREAALIDRVMTLSERDFAEMPDGDQFLSEAKTLAGHFIWTVFFNHVKNQLRRDDYTVMPVSVHGETFDDLRAVKGQRSYRVQPVAYAEYINETARRLANVMDESVQRMIVIPWRDSEPASPDPTVIVTSMAQLSKHL